jgi:hypothetical protein
MSLALLDREQFKAAAYKLAESYMSARGLPTIRFQAIEEI